jgi:hypothetical protein
MTTTGTPTNTQKLVVQAAVGRLSMNQDWRNRLFGQTRDDVRAAVAAFARESGVTLTEEELAEVGDALYDLTTQSGEGGCDTAPLYDAVRLMVCPHWPCTRWG